MLVSVEVQSLKAFMVAMEDAGELVSVFGSKKGDNDVMQPVEKIVFIMDPLKGAGAAKKRKISKVSCFVYEPAFVSTLFLCGCSKHCLCGCCSMDSFVLSFLVSLLLVFSSH